MTKKTEDIKAAMIKRYGDTKYALMFEVGDGTGGNQRRWADAIVYHIWPSDGYQIHGFEFKASRADWLNELKQPGKSHSIARYCHQWWLVVTEASIVKPGELPPEWGLMELQNDGVLRTHVKPVKKEPVTPEIPFIAAMLRRSNQLVDPTVLTSMVEQRSEGIRANVEQKFKSDMELLRARQEKTEESLTKLEKLVGVKLDDIRNGHGWSVEQYAKAFHALTTNTPEELERKFENIRWNAESIVKACKAFNPEAAA